VIDDDERLARLTLARLCEPGSVTVHAAVGERGAVDVAGALRAGRPVARIGAAAAEGARLRAERYDPDVERERLLRCGGRFVCPGDDEWPAPRLTWFGEQLREPPPLGLFVRGPHRLDALTERSVAVVGARAASAYGVQVAGELGLGLADRGWTVVSGGAFGIDGAAHRGALTSTGATTLAVLACGVDVAYPRGHADLLSRIAAEGLIVSEVPPGSAPTRGRFLVRNRLIAALAVGTVVVEAAVRSGSLTTARQAADLGRVLMAVPGPVTSVLSSGCHRLLREGATCAGSAGEVLDAVGVLSDDAAIADRAPVSARDGLSATVRRVLDAVPVRAWADEASIARVAGVPALTVLQVLPPLQVAGLVEQGLEGWRLTALGAQRPARAAS
jgi:DNA processing protein